MSIANAKDIKKFDKGLVSESIAALPEQIEQLLKEAGDIQIPRNYKNINNIVVAGMGGSNLGARIIRSALRYRLKLAITILPGYEIPRHINNQTLYILSSYSGTTEEPLSTYREVKKRKAKILAITAGGKLEKLMKRENIPGLIFDPRVNPAGQPRLGLGYSIFGTILLMNKVGLMKITKTEMKKIVAMLKSNNKNLDINTPVTKNLAKTIAKKLQNKQPILVGADFLVGNLHAFRNQFNENSKNYAAYLEVPDMNHFAMEGLAYPTTNKNIMHFLFINSDLYHKKVKLRMKLTQKIVEKNNIKCSKFSLKGKTRLEQAFELLQLGTWITYYLGILNKVDPIKIPWVDLFKAELKKA